MAHDFADHLRGPGPESEAFQAMLDSPLRVVLEVVPEKFVTRDSAKMAAHTAGTLGESKLAEPLEADAVRLARELERRGLTEGWRASDQLVPAMPRMTAVEQ